MESNACKSDYRYNPEAYLYCDICDKEGNHVWPDSKGSYEFITAQDGGAFIVFSGPIRLCQRHYDELPDERPLSFGEQVS